MVVLCTFFTSDIGCESPSHVCSWFIVDIFVTMKFHLINSDFAMPYQDHAFVSHLLLYRFLLCPLSVALSL